MKFSSKNTSDSRLTFKEFYALRKKQLNSMRNDMRKIGILKGKSRGWRDKFIEYVNNHPTELTPSLNDYRLKIFTDMRGAVSWHKINDLMQLLSDFIDVERKKKFRGGKRGRPPFVFKIGDTPKKVVMSDEDKKLFPFGSPIDRNRYK